MVDTYRCAGCGKEQPMPDHAQDASMQRELAQNFGADISVANCDMVCDSCYRSIMQWLPAVTETHYLPSERVPRLGRIVEMVRKAIEHLGLSPVDRALVTEATAHAYYYAEKDRMRMHVMPAIDVFIEQHSTRDMTFTRDDLIALCRTVTE